MKKILFIATLFALNAAIGATQRDLGAQGKNIPHTDLSFKTIAVSGQSNVAVPATFDTLGLAAGSDVAITTNAGTRTVTVAASGTGGSSRGLPAGWVDVVADYGAACNGSTNDDTAFANAIASGKNVYIPGGTTTSPRSCKLSATLHPLAGQTIQADGWGTTSITFTGKTNWLFDIDVSLVHLDGLRINQSGTPTGGGHIRFGNASKRIYNVKLTNIFSNGAYYGIEASGKNNASMLDHIVVNAAVGAAYHLNLPTPSGDLVWHDIASIYSAVGLYVRQCDTSRIVGMSFESDGKGIWLRGDKGGISGLHLSNIKNEDASDDIVIGDGGQPVSFNTISQIETYGIAVKAFTMGAYATDNIISQANLDAYRYVDNGARNTLTNSLVHSRLANTVNEEENRDTIYYSGITINGSDAIVSNTHVLDYPTGITLTANGTYAVLSGNNARGLSTPYDLNSAAKATGRGVGNIGIADW